MFKSLCFGAVMLAGGAATFAVFNSPNADTSAATILMYSIACKYNPSDKVKTAIVNHHEVRSREVETEMLIVARQMREDGMYWCGLIKPSIKDMIAIFE